MPDNTLVIILAGGKGVRIARTTRGVSKCMLPIGRGQSLLGRAIHQISSAIDWEIVVCCSTENYIEICSCPNISASKNLKVISCKDCELGPLPALSEVLKTTKADKYLLWLADIFFYNNPVPGLYEVGSKMKANGYVAIGKNLVSDCEAGSGYVEIHDEHVTNISYKTPRESFKIDIFKRWSGLCLFDQSLATDLVLHSNQYSHKALEVWLNDALFRGFTLAPIFINQFVNVNSDSDYNFILKSISSR